jgi:hypothetical protein
MSGDQTPSYSRRALEVARDLLDRLESEIQARRLKGARVSFRLDESDVLLSGRDAERWIKESVDQGFPEVRYLFERITDDEVVINLAAFEDPDSQYHA